jgi:hypothetical protein
MNARILIFFLLPLLFSGCALLAGHSQEDVLVVNSLSPEEKSSHADIGNIVFTESSEHSGDEADALERFRYSAAQMGADLVLLQEKTRVPCEMNHEWKCVLFKGRAFRKAQDHEVVAE